MKKILSSIVVASAIATSAFAGANSQTGCGLGSVVVENPNNAVMYFVQATLNASSGTQTFGITSGTLNCQKTKLVQNTKAIEFVNANVDALSAEIALGYGEHLDTLAEILNVDDTDSFKANLRANYVAIYNSSDVNGAKVLDTISTL